MLTLSDTVLGFAADSADLSTDALDLLDQVADQVPGRAGRLDLLAVGYCADPPDSTPAGRAALSLSRATSTGAALQEALTRRGFSVTIRTEGGGAAPGTTAVVDGRFDEGLAATMRRVEITLIPQPRV